jgi:hypothetical protein
MKLNKLKIPTVLYFLLTLVILNIFYFLQKQNTRSLIILILIGLITYSINENLIIVFTVSLVLTNCLFNKNNKFMEGMETKDDDKKKEQEEKKSEKEEEDSEKEEVTGSLEDTDNKPKKITDEDDPFVIDDAKNIQASYENLQKFLDSPGFNKLTDETHKLAKSQDKLMKSLSTLTPILSDAKASISNLDLSTYGSLSDIINNLGKK